MARKSSPASALAVPDTATLSRQTRDAIQALLTPKVQPDSQWLTIATHISDFYLAEYGKTGHGGPKGVLANPSTVAALLELCEKGLSPTMAATRCGISPSVITEWQEKAKEAPQGPHAAMMAALKAAHEQLRMTLLQRIQDASKSQQHWTAAGWSLERQPIFNGEYKLAEAQRNQGVTIILGISNTAVTIGESGSAGDSVSHPADLPVIDIPAKA